MAECSGGEERTYVMDGFNVLTVELRHPGGRPQSIGPWKTLEAFLSAFDQIYAHVAIGSGLSFTEANVGQYFDNSKSLKSLHGNAERTLRRWVKKAGFTDWDSFVAELRSRNGHL